MSLLEFMFELNKFQPDSLFYKLGSRPSEGQVRLRAKFKAYIYKSLNAKFEFSSKSFLLKRVY